METEPAPTKATADTRVMITLRVTPGEREALNESAAEEGLSLNNYLRRRLDLPLVTISRQGARNRARCGPADDPVQLRLFGGCKCGRPIREGHGFMGRTNGGLLRFLCDCSRVNLVNPKDL